MTNHFRVTGYIETSAPNDSNWPWTIRSKNVPHVCATNTTESQIAISYAPLPVLLALQDSLKQAHYMTPKWHWTIKGQRCLIPVLLRSTPRGWYSNLFSSRGQAFSWYRCTEWPQNDLEYYEVKAMHMWPTSTLSPSPFCSTASPGMADHYESNVPNVPQITLKY